MIKVVTALVRMKTIVCWSPCACHSTTALRIVPDGNSQLMVPFSRLLTHSPIWLAKSSPTYGGACSSGKESYHLRNLAPKIGTHDVVFNKRVSISNSNYYRSD